MNTSLQNMHDEVGEHVKSSENLGQKITKKRAPMASTLLRSAIVAVLFAQASALAVDMHLHSRPSAFNKVSPAANNVLNAPRVAFQPVCAGGGSGG
jgi:hypothetical protein